MPGGAAVREQPAEDRVDRVGGVAGVDPVALGGHDASGGRPHVAGQGLARGQVGKNIEEIP
jgi:hypothetical protein